MNIYQKLLKIQQSCNGLGKDSRGNNYEFVSGSKVLSVIKPLMNELGILLKQEVINVQNSRQDYATKNNPNKSEILSSVQMKFTWVDCETGEKDENLFAANGQNDWDKGVGSALTYGERYFLLKFFHIATDEDDIDNPKEEHRIDDLVTELTPMLKNCNTLEELTEFFSVQENAVKKSTTFINACAARKKELL